MFFHIPYKGGKIGISRKIVSYILSENPRCRYFYDLFGGGGSISFEAIKYKQIEKCFIMILIRLL